jgi:hypothetical protein
MRGPNRHACFFADARAKEADAGACTAFPACAARGVMSHTALRAPCAAAAAAAAPALASSRAAPAPTAAGVRVRRGALRALAAPLRAAAAPRHAAPAGTRPQASLAADEADLFTPAGSRQSGIEIDVPRLAGRTAGGAPRETVPSPFCTFSACALPAAPRSGPRNSVNLCHAFVSDDDRVMLKSIAYGNPTSAGAEDCDAECNFTPQWCAASAARGAARARARTHTHAQAFNAPHAGSPLTEPRSLLVPSAPGASAPARAPTCTSSRPRSRPRWSPAAGCARV